MSYVDNRHCQAFIRIFAFPREGDTDINTRQRLRGRQIRIKQAQEVLGYLPFVGCPCAPCICINLRRMDWLTLPEKRALKAKHTFRTMGLGPLLIPIQLVATAMRALADRRRLRMQKLTNGVIDPL
jgi:hypothetical protein